jgi:hypothetical protein
MIGIDKISKLWYAKLGGLGVCGGNPKRRANQEMVASRMQEANRR